MPNAHARLVCSAPARSRALHVDLGVLAQLEGAIEHCVNVNNDDPKPFTLRKTADDILASVQRFCLQTSRSRHQRCAAKSPEEATPLCPHERLKESDGDDGPGNHPHGDGQGGIAPQQ